MSLGKRIRSLREDNGYNKSEFGAFFGVKYSAVTCWENGSFAPNRDRLTKMSELFKVSVEWILNGIETKQAELPTESHSVPSLDAKNEPTTLDMHSYKHIVGRFKQLSPERKGRLIGYVSALSGEMIEKDGKKIKGGKRCD